MNKRSFLLLFVFSLSLSRSFSCPSLCPLSWYGIEMLALFVLCPFIHFFKPMVMVLANKRTDLKFVSGTVISAIISSFLLGVYVVFLGIPEFILFVPAIMYPILLFCKASTTFSIDHTRSVRKIVLVGWMAGFLSFFLMTPVFHKDMSITAYILLSVLIYMMITYSVLKASILIEHKILESYLKEKIINIDPLFWANSLLLILVFSICAIHVYPERVSSKNGLIPISALHDFQFLRVK
ncbi:hypothetical protein MJH12_12475 [bacterium]|nr:hypothetical protein [bacterium]